MPKQLTVSRNRKTSKNFNSEAFGVSLTVEMDQSLRTQPNKLQKKIDYLYREADAAPDRQANADNGSKANGDRLQGNGHRPRNELDLLDQAIQHQDDVSRYQDDRHAAKTRDGHGYHDVRTTPLGGQHGNQRQQGSGGGHVAGIRRAFILPSSTTAVSY